MFLFCTSAANWLNLERRQWRAHFTRFTEVLSNSTSESKWPTWHERCQVFLLHDFPFADRSALPCHERSKALSHVTGEANALDLYYIYIVIITWVRSVFLIIFNATGLEPGSVFSKPISRNSRYSKRNWIVTYFMSIINHKYDINVSIIGRISAIILQ